MGIPVLIVLVGVSSGLLAGVVSQLVAGYFKSRGDNKQLRANREQFERLEGRWLSE